MNRSACRTPPLYQAYYSSARRWFRSIPKAATPEEANLHLLTLRQHWPSTPRVELQKFLPPSPDVPLHNYAHALAMLTLRQHWPSTPRVEPQKSLARCPNAWSTSSPWCKVPLLQYNHIVSPLIIFRYRDRGLPRLVSQRPTNHPHSQPKLYIHFQSSPLL